MPASEIVAAVAALAEAMPKGKVVVEVMESKHETDSGVRLTPANPSAAPVAVLGEDANPTVQVFVGESTDFEFTEADVGQPTTKATVLEICRAVFQGQFEETTWWRGARRVRGIGRVQLAERQVSARWSALFSNPFRRVRTTLKRFEPY